MLQAACSVGVVGTEKVLLDRAVCQTLAAQRTGPCWALALAHAMCRVRPHPCMPRTAYNHLRSSTSPKKKLRPSSLNDIWPLLARV